MERAQVPARTSLGLQPSLLARDAHATALRAARGTQVVRLPQQPRVPEQAAARHGRRRRPRLPLVHARRRLRDVPALPARQEAQAQPRRVTALIRVRRRPLARAARTPPHAPGSEGAAPMRARDARKGRTVLFLHRPGPSRRRTHARCRSTQRRALPPVAHAAAEDHAQGLARPCAADGAPESHVILKDLLNKMETQTDP